MSRGRSKSASGNGAASSAKSLRPTDPELTILQALWRKGPSTMREIHEEVSTSLGYSITTVGTYLRIMKEKGLVDVERNDYAWRYAAKCSEEKVQQSLVASLLKKAFGGSPSKLLMQAFASKEPTAEELAAIERLYKKHKKT